jgi:hypothetical protein
MGTDQPLVLYTRLLAPWEPLSFSPSMSLPTLEANPAILPEAQKDDNASVPVTPVTPQSYDEPVVTRRELWSYYGVYQYIFLSFEMLLTASLQHIPLGITYVSIVLFDIQHAIPVLIFDHVSNTQGLGPTCENHTVPGSCLI